MDTSVLFSGLHFDQKKFEKEVLLFKTKRIDSSNDEKAFAPLSLELGSTPSYEHSPGAGEEMEADVRTKKRKKRKPTVDNEDFAIPVTIFKRPARAPRDDVLPEVVVPKPDKKKAEARRAEEVCALRKKFHLHVVGQSIPPPLVDFEQLRALCKKSIMREISGSGYSDPTPIQRQAVPVLLKRRDCLACAPTGSGKTLAFMLPIVMNLMASVETGIRAVVVCPVRELASQTAREFNRIVPGKSLRVRALTSSLCRSADFSKLPCDVLVATPLRLERLLKAKKIDLVKVQYLIMDESDKLFEMGFVEQVDCIVAACSNAEVVRALFSATLPDSVEELARSIMHDAIRIVVGERNTATSTVAQRLVYVGSEEGKLLAVKQILSESLRPPILLFLESKERAKELHRELAVSDIKVDSIHADRSQQQRDAAVENFRAGKTWVLIATDVMARGMDFKGVNCVINYDFPKASSTYIHRVGRSGRAGRSGEAVTLYTEKDVPYLRSIAHVMCAAGNDVPDWMLALPKVKPKKWKKH